MKQDIIIKKSILNHVKKFYSAIAETDANINELNKYYLKDAKEFFKASRKCNLPTIICSTVPENNDQKIDTLIIDMNGNGFIDKIIHKILYFII